MNTNSKERMTSFIARQRRNLLVWAALGLILLTGAAFRYQAPGWDQGQYFHPDERAIINYTSQLNTVLTTGAENGPRAEISFPPGGLSFFLPNDKAKLRPASPEETEAYYGAQASNQTFSLPANVLPPDQPVPSQAINFWNPNFSPLNSHFFAYGDFPKYLIKLSGHIMSAVTGHNWYDWEHLTLIGRLLSASWSMGTLLLVFWLGRLVFKPYLGRDRAEAIGLLAAAFQAVTVLDIQLAHYAAFDVTQTFFITLTLYMALRLMRSGRRLTAVGLGAAIGLALASKISAAPVILAAVIAALLYGLYGQAQVSGERAGRLQVAARPGLETSRYGQGGAALGPRLLSGAILNLFITGLTALAVWFVAMPYAFIDFGSFSKRLIEEAGMSRGVDSFPYTRQYVGTIPFLYQAGNLLQWGMSIPLGLLALAGTGYSLWQTARQRLKAEIVLWSFLLPYSLITFSAEAKFNRYLLPILPVLVILAARVIVETAAKNRTARLYTRPQGINSRLEKLKKFWPQRPRIWVMSGLAVLAFGWAGLWAISFSQIYAKEQPMNQASRWMAQNIPAGASISNELWDEGLPTRITASTAGSKGWCDPDMLAQSRVCQPVQMDLYGDAPNDVKVDYFVNQVRKTDYILISSNRLYATMPKLPWRYPIQIRFYELLFAGKLGYDKVGSFTSYPRLPLLNLEINDDQADESFTVYDHPKVLIFKKSNPLADDEVRGLFAQAAQVRPVFKRYPGPNDLPVRTAGQCVPQGSARPECDGVLSSATAGLARETNKSLLLDQPVDRLPVVNDMAWNKLANDNQWLAVGLWFLLFQVIGLVGLPIAWRVCRRLPDRGYILAKPLGAVIIALVIWIMVWTRLFMNTAVTAWTAVGLTALFSGWLWWRNHHEINDWLAHHRRLIAIEEAIFGAVFIVWVLFRLGNPDLWHPFFGGEKPMEMTHLQGILKSAYFPPYDPWFADGYINYYYYGQYMVSNWIKLSGINPYIAFNLAVPVLYAFTCTAAFSLVYNMAGKYRQNRTRWDASIDPERIRGPIIAGLFGMTIFALVGNMDGFIQLLQRFRPLTELANNLQLYPDKVEPLVKFDYFRSSRVIPGTINEFPSFSFIYSDLHAHLIALPITLIALAIAFNLVATDWKNYSARTGGGLNIVAEGANRLWEVFDRSLVTPVTAMIVIGFVGATNSWDLPTYLLVISAAVFMALFRRYNLLKLRPRLFELGLDLLLTGLVFATTLLGALSLYWNFFSHYQAFFTKIALVPDILPTNSYRNDAIVSMSGRTEFKYFLVIFLLPLILLLTYLLWNFSNWLRSGHPAATGSNGGYQGNYLVEEWEAADGDPFLPQPVQLTLPGFILEFKPPGFAFSISGADGGSALTGSGGGPGFPDTRARRPRYNGFARRWIIGTCLFCLFLLCIGLVAPNDWLVFMFALAMMAACLVLTFVRPLDYRHSEQSAEGIEPAGGFLRLLLLASFGIVAALEVVYLQDDMVGGEHTRMNTIFKFYYQVWAMVCLGAGFAAYLCWTRWLRPGWERQRGNFWRMVWVISLGLILFCVSVYPVQAIPARLLDRASEPIPGPTLDGRAYYKTLRTVVGMPNMPNGKVFDHYFEAQSVFEFYDNVKGTPVILQASIWPYRGGGSFIPINTGLPVVLGWDHHERQQRWSDMVSLRSGSGGQSGLIRQIYNTASIQEALELLNHYHVTYIHLGTIERESEIPNRENTNFEQYMSEEGYAKFEQMLRLGLLEISYQNPGVVVYKLTARGESSIITGDLAAAGVVSIIDPKLRKLEETLKLSPNSPIAHYNLGQYYAAKKQFDKAAAELEAVIKLDPNKVNPYHVLGDIYREAGDTGRALEQYKIATEIPAKPEEQPAAFNKLGVALQGLGRFDEALMQFDRTLSLNRNFSEAYYHQGEIYEALGKRTAALEAYGLTITNSQKRDDFWALRANQRIRELGGR